MGALIDILKTDQNTCKIIAKSSKLKNIYVSSKYSSALIDEYPILSIAAACAEGEMTMKGLEELRYKESDRFSAIVDGLNKSGADVKSFKDNITIRGKIFLKGGCVVNANNDHRIAMAFNILSLISEKPIFINGNKSIMTSFPSFFSILKEVGAKWSIHGKENS